VALMVFPATKLGVACDLNLGGTWTDVSGWALQEGSPALTAFTITRGRPDETASATPGTLAMKLNNVDGRFTIRNPTGPYYGQLTRNTPVRVSVPDSSTHLRFEDDTTSFISAPTSAGLSVTGDLELQLDLNLSTYVPAVLASKDNAASQRSWSIRLNGDGTIGFYWFDAGSAPTLVISTAPLPLGRISLRITLAVASGTVTFWTSTTPINGAPSWTQLGATSVTGATSVFSSTAAVSVGYNAAITALGSGFGGPAGKFYGFRIYAGIAGTLKGSPDFTAATPGNATLTDAQANVWTLNGTAVFSARSYRFHGEMSSLPQQWDVTGHDAWTPITGGGLLRRLQQGSTPVKSVMRRGAGPGGLASVYGFRAYWPGEDAAGSRQIASGLAAGTPMAVAGAAAFQGQPGSPSSDPAFTCSAPLPQIQSSVWNGAVSYLFSLNWTCGFLLSVPAGLPNNSEIIRLAYIGDYLSVVYTTAAGGTLTLSLTGGASVAGPTGVNGAALWVSMSSSPGTSTLTVLPVGATAETTYTMGFAPVASASRVIVNPAGANLAATTVGHAWVSPVVGPDLAANANLLNAWSGEAAGTRFARLCAENSVQARVYGYPAVSAAMGPQPVDTLTSLLQFCEDADRGQIFEPRTCLGLGYRTLGSMCNQAPAVTLSVAADEVAPPLSPLDDDALLRNDVTVTRSGGLAAQVQVTSGPLSVNPPPAGAGDYPASLTVYCATDSQPPDIAGWMTWAGTTDQERFPQVTVDLASAKTAVQAILPAVRDADIGAYAAVTGLTPPWLPPGPVAQLIYGSTEQLGDFAWQITWNTVPELPYETAVADDTVLGYADTDGSTLAAGVTSSAVTLSVATTTAGSPLWTTTAGDFPFDILIAGEQLTVTNITGASSPQSFTVTRSVNGVVKAQMAGADMRLFHAPVAALI
jgi:hypothetical protein